MYDPDESINVSPWPTYDEGLVDEEAERAGDTVIAAISEIRREKNRAGVSLNAPLTRLDVYAPAEQLSHLEMGRRDIVDTLKIGELALAEGEGGALKVEGHPEIGFTLTV
jgi:valyl-tRNA synthetase